MEKKMLNIKVLTREAIKPSSPTPNHLRSFKLSFIDQHSDPMYITLILFYSANEVTTMSAEEKSGCLKKSLSEVLTLYFPLAGRIKDLSSVDCNDQGALFIDARAKGSTLGDLLLQQPDANLKKLVSLDSAGYLLIIQATLFDCGGLTIGFTFDHNVVDGVAMDSFLKAWSTVAVSPTLVQVPDLFSASSLFPPVYPPPVYTPAVESLKKLPEMLVGGVAIRYVFSPSSIAQLKTLVAGKTVPNPTRFEVVSALILKCRIMASTAGGGPRKPSMVTLPVNLRPSFEPPLPQHSFGNIAMCIIISLGGGVPEEDLSSLVENTRKIIKEFRQSCVKKLQGDAGFEFYMEHKAEQNKILCSGGDFEMHMTNSWCRFGFYQADFGWGKPTWASRGLEVIIPGMNLLMDTQDGDGIEACLCFSGEEEVTLFETNGELLKYASRNPPVL